MKKTIKAALKGITTATAGFLKKRGIYVVALALISAAALSAVLTVKQPNGADPAQTDDTAVSECGDKSHVHFELLKDEKYVDPQSYVLFIKELEG